MNRAGKGAIAAVVAGTALTAMATPASAGEIVITITDMRSTKGVVRACLTTDKKSFPNCRKDPNALRVVVPAATDAKIRFTGVEPGTYAIALLHDENGNGKADRALGMMPKEGFGFSRDAKVRLGPPKFKNAVFDHNGSDQAMTIKMRYLL